MTPPGAIAHAALYAENARWDDALAVLAAHLASFPDDADAWCLIAQCHLGMNDPGAAENAARCALAIEPDSEWPHRLASIALLEQRGFTRARQEAEEAVRLAPLAWQTHLQRARVDFTSGQINEETWVSAHRAVELGPDQPGTHLVFGSVALREKKFKIAVEEFHECLRLDPANVNARNNLAVIHLRRRRLGSAGKLLSSALRTSPNSALLAANLRVVLRASIVILSLVGLIGAWILQYGLAGHRERLPGVGTTPYRHIVPSGRPAVLIIVALVLLAVFVAAAIAINRTVGRNAVRVFVAATRSEATLAVAVSACVFGFVLVELGLLTGMPAARALIDVAAIVDLAAVIISRFFRKRLKNRNH